MGAEWLDADITENAVAFTVDERVYFVEAILRTAYGLLTGSNFYFKADRADAAATPQDKTPDAGVPSPGGDQPGRR